MLNLQCLQRLIHQSLKRLKLAKQSQYTSSQPRLLHGQEIPSVGGMLLHFTVSSRKTTNRMYQQIADAAEDGGRGRREGFAHQAYSREVWWIGYSG